MKKITLLLPFTLLLLAVVARADSTDITITDTVKQLLYTDSLKVGFYKNYKEFVNNAPSIFRHFEIFEEEVKEKDKAAGYMMVTYMVDKKEKIIKEDIWGFCDGSSVYIRQALTNVFFRLGYIGKYSYFTKSAGPFGVFVIDEAGIPRHAIPEYLMELFEQRPLLMDQYMSDPNKRKKVKQYLIQFNEQLKNKQPAK